jgi:exodeoxyribonuclease VII large subunit
MTDDSSRSGGGDRGGSETGQGQFSLDFAPPRRVLTVMQLTRAVKGRLEREFDDVWVQGEIGNLKPHQSGHTYFNLKDAKADACVRAVLFRQSARGVKFKITEGLEVLARGRLTVYEPRGDYQFLVDQMEPVGAGARQLAFEQLKAKLLAEGLIDPARRKKIPFFPRRIALVTSPTGAAVRDVLSVIARRAPHTQVLVIPVRVQGPGAAEEIAAGVARADAGSAGKDRYEGVAAKGGTIEWGAWKSDVIIVGRGGGSAEDLWAFNEEVVARAIAACKTPTISAVGHEIDVTIADFVADRRAPTPSVAAEIAVPDEREIRGRIADCVRRLDLGSRKRVAKNRERIDDLRRRVKDPRRFLADQRLRVDDLVDRGARSIERQAGTLRTELASARRHLQGAGPAARLPRERQRVENASSGSRVGIEKRLARQRSRLAELAARLDSISPLGVLSRGFALVRDESGHVVRRAADVTAGQALDVKLAEGEIEVTVKGTK